MLNLLHKQYCKWFHKQRGHTLTSSRLRSALGCCHTKPNLCSGIIDLPWKTESLHFFEDERARKSALHCVAQNISLTFNIVLHWWFGRSWMILINKVRPFEEMNLLFLVSFQHHFYTNWLWQKKKNHDSTANEGSPVSASLCVIIHKNTSF